MTNTTSNVEVTAVVKPVFKSERQKVLDQLSASPPNGYFVELKETLEVRSEGFLNTNDKNFVGFYGPEIIIDLIAREDLNCYDQMLKLKANVNLKARAVIIDILFASCM